MAEQIPDFNQRVKAVQQHMQQAKQAQQQRQQTAAQAQNAEKDLSGMHAPLAQDQSGYSNRGLEAEAQHLFELNQQADLRDQIEDANEMHDLDDNNSN